MDWKNYCYHSSCHELGKSVQFWQGFIGSVYCSSEQRYTPFRNIFGPFLNFWLHKNIQSLDDSLHHPITTCHHVYSEGFHTDVVHRLLPLTGRISKRSKSEMSSCTEVWHVTISVVLIGIMNRISLSEEPAAFLLNCLCRLMDIDLEKRLHIFLTHRCHMSRHFPSSVFSRGGSYRLLSGQSGHRGHDLTTSMSQKTDWKSIYYMQTSLKFTL